MNYKLRSALPSLIGAGLALGWISQASAEQETPCVTQSECALREQLNDQRARQQQWDRNLKMQSDAADRTRQLQAEARARVQGDRQARYQELLRRRRHTAAQAGN